MSFTDPPFALFCAVEVPSETLNGWLEDNAESDPDASDLLLVSSETFSNAPQGPEFGAGTKFPIKEELTWPFKGKTVEECVKTLRDAPKNAGLDRHHFALADDQSLRDGTMVVCKVGDRNLKGDELSTYRSPAGDVAGFLAGLEPGTWEEMQENRHRAEVLGS